MLANVTRWSRGEERITERFPEIVDAAATLPEGVVLDGEVVAWKDERIQPFALLQQRIGRKKLTAAILVTVPVQFLAYDLLELGRSGSSVQRHCESVALSLKSYWRTHRPSCKSHRW